MLHFVGIFDTCTQDLCFRSSKQDLDSCNSLSVSILEKFIRIRGKGVNIEENDPPPDTNRWFPQERWILNFAYERYIPVDCQFNTDITCMKNHLNTDYNFYTDCYVLKIKVVLWPLEIITRQLKFCLATKLSCLVVNGPLHFKSYFDGWNRPTRKEYFIG